VKFKGLWKCNIAITLLVKKQKSWCWILVPLLKNDLYTAYVYCLKLSPLFLCLLKAQTSIDLLVTLGCRCSRFYCGMEHRHHHLLLADPAQSYLPGTGVTTSRYSSVCLPWYWRPSRRHTGVEGVCALQAWERSTVPAGKKPFTGVPVFLQKQTCYTESECYWVQNLTLL
jgi:hypothetical protein